MNTFQDSKGNLIKLGKKLGAGGEGAVYLVENLDDVVAKIYHEPITPQKSRKLRQMVGLQNEKLLKIAAWTIETLHQNADGSAVGFLMPAISAKEIHELYTIKSRKRYFPQVDWRFLIHVAANVARAFYAVHNNGHTIGDVNHGNCVVLRDGTVKLIDCDSYTIKTEDETFHCEVGVSTHTPPELQGKNLRETPRTPNHDAFGLAVVIFQLLFLGRHPFAGTVIGAEDKTLEECIAENLFAFGQDAVQRGIKQPPASLPLSAVSPDLALLFEKAFLQNDNRPTAEKWIVALEKFAENLQQCTQNQSHYFYAADTDLSKTTECVWCRLEKQSKINFFDASSNSIAKGAAEVDLVTIDNLLQNLREMAPLTRFSAVPPALPPSPKIKKLNRKVFAYLTFGLIGSVILTVLLTGFFAVFGTAISLFLISACVSLITRNFKSELDSLEENLNQSEDEYGILNKQLIAENRRGDNFIKQLQNVRELNTNFTAIEQEHLTQIKELEKQSYSKQLSIYLRQHVISSHSGINLTFRETELLNSRKLRTAEDISNSYPLEIHQFPKLADDLNKWYTTVSANFKFNPNNQSMLAVLDQTKYSFDEKRLQLRYKLINTVTPIQREFEEWKEKVFTLNRQIYNKYTEISQIQVDLESARPSPGRNYAFAFCWLIASAYGYSWYSSPHWKEKIYNQEIKSAAPDKPLAPVPNTAPPPPTPRPTSPPPPPTPRLMSPPLPPPPPRPAPPTR